MLVLSRKVGERIQIGPNVVVTVVRISGSIVRIGIDAPLDMAVTRTVDIDVSEEIELTIEPQAMG